MAAPVKGARVMNQTKLMRPGSPARWRAIALSACATSVRPMGPVTVLVECGASFGVQAVEITGYVGFLRSIAGDRMRPWLVGAQQGRQARVIGGEVREHAKPAAEAVQ